MRRLLRTLRRRRLRVGVVANEFFAPELGSEHRLHGRMGGFGWAARQVVRCFADRKLGVDVVLISGEHVATEAQTELTVHGTRLLLKRSDEAAQAAAVRAEGLDVLLTIDYRSSYLPTLRAVPDVPVIVWVRNPRTPEDVAEVATLRIPGRPGEVPAGIGAADCATLAQALEPADRRRVAFASPAPGVVEPRIASTYEVPPAPVAMLPNPVDLPQAGTKASSPQVVFLGRLDPIKRPWLFFELAPHFPEVEFVVLGQSYVGDPPGSGPEAGSELPSNLKLHGHVDDGEKEDVLRSAWVLVNTSIHEALPVSFLEALALETPIVSCQDPEGVSSRFGRYVGRFDGDGMDSLPHFRAALSDLLADEPERARLGREGREWVRRHHGRSPFIAAFSGLCARLGVLQGGLDLRRDPGHGPVVDRV